LDILGSAPDELPSEPPADHGGFHLLPKKMAEVRHLIRHQIGIVLREPFQHGIETFNGNLQSQYVA
jgi:hypothetical protein